MCSQVRTKSRTWKPRKQQPGMPMMYVDVRVHTLWPFHRRRAGKACPRRPTQSIRRNGSHRKVGYHICCMPQDHRTSDGWPTVVKGLSQGLHRVPHGWLWTPSGLILCISMSVCPSISCSIPREIARVYHRDFNKRSEIVATSRLFEFISRSIKKNPQHMRTLYRKWCKCDYAQIIVYVNM